VRFRERARGTLIRTHEGKDVPVDGRFCSAKGFPDVAQPGSAPDLPHYSFTGRGTDSVTTAYFLWARVPLSGLPHVSVMFEAA